jgi:hypothetical protein
MRAEHKSPTMAAIPLWEIENGVSELCLSRCEALELKKAQHKSAVKGESDEPKIFLLFICPFRVTSLSLFPTGGKSEDILQSAEFELPVYGRCRRCPRGG